MELEIIEENVRKLLHDDVVNNTYKVMTELRDALRSVAARRQTLSLLQRARLRKILEPLISESIREALHKRELPITNEIIRHKNAILCECGVVLDESHAEIDPKKYKWDW